MSGGGGGGGGGAPPYHHDHHPAACGCALRPQPLQQSLDELEFERSACKAALDGDVERLRRLQATRPHLLDEASGGAGLVPLHYACRAGKTDAARFLLGGAPWRAACASSGGATPLHKAAACGHAGIAAMLLDAAAGRSGIGGGRRRQQGGGGGGRAEGGEEGEDGAPGAATAAARLLALAVDSDGATALHLACASGRRAAAEVLLRACPETASVRDRRGRTARERWPREQEGEGQGGLPWPDD